LKWGHWLIFALCIFAYYFIKYVILGNHGPDNKILKWLDNKTIEKKKKIEKINDRINKRKLLREVIIGKKIKMDKKIKSMSDRELDRYLKRHL